jgi:hypothetical protein
MIKLRKAVTVRANKAVIWSKRNEFPEKGQSIELCAIHYLHITDVVDESHNLFPSSVLLFINLLCSKHNISLLASSKH